MKLNKILILSALYLSAFSGAHAAVLSISQTNNFVDVNATNSPTLTWQQFNPSLGTLTGINFSVSGYLSGSFNVAAGAANVQVEDSSSRYRFSFDGTNGPGTVNSANINPIPTTPESDIGYQIALNTNQTFTINNGNNLSYASLVRDWFNSSPNFVTYFTGTGSVSSIVAQILSVSTTGGSYTLNSDLAKTAGTATLTYTYVPEPSSGSLILLGLGGLVALRRARRS